MPLHLPDLHVEGFRGIDLLTVPRLGRVTLIAGKNSVGKTTVLDAVRVYAARASAQSLSALLRGREEVASSLDEDGDVMVGANPIALFHGRNILNNARVIVGSQTLESRLTIEAVNVGDEESLDIGRLFPHALDGIWYMLKVNFHGRERPIQWLFPAQDIGTPKTLTSHRMSYPFRRPNAEDGPFRPIECESLGPGLPANNVLARLWDSAINRGDENLAIEPLQMIFGDTVESVTMVGEEMLEPRRSGRRAVVKVTSSRPRVMPLKSLGDGALRLYSVSLALTNSRDGFLLIDEAENGLHYSIQRDFWRMVLQAAYANNVQVLATTHSADCIRGFAEAANENPNLDGVYFRMERDAEGVYTVDYPKDDLLNAARNRTEMR